MAAQADACAKSGGLIGISNDQMINEFVNASSNLYNGAITQYLPELLKESTLATNLILLIKKEYHQE